MSPSVRNHTFAPGLARDYLELSKPRILGMTGFAALVGFYVAHPGPIQAASLGLAFATAVGTILVGAGACVLNQVMEREHDAKMDRTANRPIPAGRISAGAGSVCGLLLSIMGLALLVGFVNPLAASVALLTLAIYLVVYTPLKRVTPLAVVVGAFPGALPPVIGWTAATGTLDPMAALPFAILFVWQLPHFMSIAWMYRDDFARGGYPVLPVVDPSGRRTVRHMILYSMALIPVSLLPTLLGMAGKYYYFGTFVAGFAFLAVACEVARLRTRAAARQHVLASLAYLTVVFALLTIDKAAS